MTNLCCNIREIITIIELVYITFVNDIFCDWFLDKIYNIIVKPRVNDSCQQYVETCLGIIFDAEPSFKSHSLRLIDKLQKINSP